MVPERPLLQTCYTNILSIYFNLKQKQPSIGLVTFQIAIFQSSSTWHGTYSLTLYIFFARLWPIIKTKVRHTHSLTVQDRLCGTHNQTSI